MNVKILKKNFLILLVIVFSFVIGVYANSSLSANNVLIDNSSGISSTNIQDAIDEIYDISINNKEDVLLDGNVVNNELLGNLNTKINNTTDSGILEESDNINFYVSYQDNKGILYSENKINVTNYKYLNYYFIMTSNNNLLSTSVSIGLSSNNDIDGDFDVKVDFSMTGQNQNIYSGMIDVSELTGEYYLKILLNHGSETEAYTSHINIKYLSLSNSDGFNKGLNVYKDYYGENLSGINATLVHHVSFRGASYTNGRTETWYVSQSDIDTYKAFVIIASGSSVGVSLTGATALVGSGLINVSTGRVYFVKTDNLTAGQYVSVYDSYYYDGITVIGLK